MSNKITITVEVYDDTIEKVENIISSALNDSGIDCTYDIECDYDAEETESKALSDIDDYVADVCGGWL